MQTHYFHRYYIPFAKMDAVSIEKGIFNKRLNIATKIEGVPDYIVSSDKKLLDFAILIENRVKSHKANAPNPEKPRG